MTQSIDESAGLEAWIGRVLDGRYRLVEVLGEGGMGAVFVADHLTLHKQVALKIVHPEQAGSEGAAARFAREAMVTSRIDHPNVISAIDYGTLSDGSAFLAMQLVRGPTLTEVLEQEGCLPWPRAVEVAAQIADGLSAAREHGIVHRDLKPDNILVQRRNDGSELVKVLDFGVARFARESLAPPAAHAARQVTRAGTVIGTPGYMAPEQIVGKPADHRSDLYALGVMLWECVVGKSLWDAGDIQELAQRQLTETPETLREASGDLTIPDSLDALVAALLSRQAFDRPESVEAVRDVLRDALRGVPVPVRRHSQALIEEIEAERRAAERTTLEEPAAARPAQRVTGASTPVSTESRRPHTLPPRRSRFIFGVMAVLVAAVGLVMTGQLEVKPKGEVQRITQTLAPSVLPPEPEPVAEPPAPPAPPPLPEAVGAALETLARADSRSERVAAANAVLTHIPADDVPAYARGVARLQLAETCREKAEMLIDLRALGDPRVLPALRLLSERKRGGCGYRGREDCLACLRDELQAGIEALEAKSLQPSGAPEAAAAPAPAPPGTAIE